MSSEGGANAVDAPEPGGAGRPLLSLALAGMLDAVDGLAGAVYLLAPDEPTLVMAAAAGLPRAFAAPWERVGLSAPIPVADAVRQRHLVWVGDEEEMNRRYPRIAVVMPYPFALAALPVATPEAVHGAVFVVWAAAHPPELSDREREALTSACERLALRLERATEAGEPAFVDGADLLGPSEGNRPSAVEAAHLLDRLPEGLCSLDLDGRVTYMNRAALSLLHTRRNRLLGRQPWAALPWLNDPDYEDRHRAALISQQPTWFTALRSPDHPLRFDLVPDRSGVSVRITPTGDRTDTTVLGPGARQPAVASMVTLSHILAMASALTQAVAVRDVCEVVADEFMPAVGSQALVVLGSDNGRLQVLGHRGYADPHVVERFHGMPLTAATPSAEVLITGTPVFFETRRLLEERFPARYATPDGMSAWAYLPLIASGRPVGTCVLGYTQPHRFPAEERAVLAGLAGLIAQALERAQLYDAKHRLAHGLQAALLPPSLPVVPGLEVAARYLPCTLGMDVGGDFYDLTTNGHTGAVIGDVQGHNVAAAALMGQVRTAIRAYSTLGQPPDQVLEHTNRLLVDLQTDLFASCLYARLDPDSHQVILARAGHPPPLLRNPARQVQVLDLAGGPLLGIDRDAHYPATAVALPPGAILALYTDGLVELPGTDLDDNIAACAKVLAHASLDTPLDELADQLTAVHGAARPRSDDVALLLLRHRP